MLDIAKDILSLTGFRRRSAEFMNQLKKSKRPIVLTVEGKAAAVVCKALKAISGCSISLPRAGAGGGILQGIEDARMGRCSVCQGVFRRVRSRAWHTKTPRPS